MKKTIACFLFFMLLCLFVGYNYIRDRHEILWHNSFTNNTIDSQEKLIVIRNYNDFCLSSAYPSHKNVISSDFFNKNFILICYNFEINKIRPLCYGIYPIIVSNTPGSFNIYGVSGRSDRFFKLVDKRINPTN